MLWNYVRLLQSSRSHSKAPSQCHASPGKFNWCTAPLHFCLGKGWSSHTLTACFSDFPLLKSFYFQIHLLDSLLFYDFVILPQVIALPELDLLFTYQIVGKQYGICTNAEVRNADSCCQVSMRTLIPPCLVAELISATKIAVCGGKG